MTEKDPREIRLIYKAKSLDDDDDVVDYGKLAKISFTDSQPYSDWVWWDASYGQVGDTSIIYS